MNGPGTRPIRLLLVDHQPSVRRGLRMRLALEEDLELVGEAGGATEAISLASDLRPDVILMDVELSGVSGIAATESLRVAAPHSAVVIYTLRDDRATRVQARAAGASAFVPKYRTEEVLLATIRAVAATYAKQGSHDRPSAGTGEGNRDDLRDYRDA